MKTTTTLKRTRIPGIKKLRKSNILKVIKAMQVKTDKPVDVLKLLGRK